MNIWRNMGVKRDLFTYWFLKTRWKTWTLGICPLTWSFSIIVNRFSWCFAEYPSLFLYGVTLLQLEDCSLVGRIASPKVPCCVVQVVSEIGSMHAERRGKGRGMQRCYWKNSPHYLYSFLSKFICLFSIPALAPHIFVQGRECALCWENRWLQSWEV